MSEDKATVSGEKAVEKKDHWESFFDDAEAQAKEAENNYEKIFEGVEASINEVEKQISKALDEE